MSTGNDTRVSCMGDMMALRLKMRGVASLASPTTMSPGYTATPAQPIGAPHHLADEVADEAFDAVQYKEFVAAHLRRGRSIFGLFPATQEGSRIDH